MTKGKLAVIITASILGIAVLAFLAQTGIYVYKIKTGKIIENFTVDKNLPAISVQTINVSEILSASSPYFGAANPKLTIVEFGGFACPNSKAESQVAREIMLEHKDDVKFIYRDFPLDDIYPESSILALAGKCAAEQGKFWQMHDKLYAAQTSSPETIISQVGLDEGKFSACMSTQKYLDDLQKDFDQGYKNGVQGTPTFFFIKNGITQMVEGAIPKDTFEEIVNGYLQ